MIFVSGYIAIGVIRITNPRLNSLALLIIAGGFAVAFAYVIDKRARANRNAQVEQQTELLPNGTFRTHILDLCQKAAPSTEDYTQPSADGTVKLTVCQRLKPNGTPTWVLSIESRDSAQSKINCGYYRYTMHELAISPDSILMEYYCQVEERDDEDEPGEGQMMTEPIERQLNYLSQDEYAMLHDAFRIVGFVSSKVAD